MEGLRDRSADFIVAEMIRREEFYPRQVMTMHETFKAFPLFGTGNKWTMYALGADSFLTQRWEKLTRRTRGYGADSTTGEVAPTVLQGRPFDPSLLGFDVFGYNVISSTEPQSASK